INEPPLLKIDSISTRKASCPQLADGELEAFVSGGTPPYNYSWSMNASTDALASGFPKGDYQVVVTDANGCTTSGSQIVEEATPLIKLPNAFSPNADNTNDTFRPANSCPVEYQLTVYSRWGSVIFNTTDITLGWDGTFEGSPAPQGKYSYFARWVIDANGTVTTEEVRGEFKLIR
ncbi:MAG: gliding motility-associated C-terminal domain-containing protein, partial [Cytophagia bacterium]|nr:gliding motility-associated C-terminal domain-containing protein [Cytophagia bacterium]